MYFSGKDCGEPQILQHGEIVMAPSDTKYDSIISYACTEAGYELHGHPDVMCSANGTWTTQPECRSEYFGARWLSEYDADLKLALYMGSTSNRNKEGRCSEIHSHKQKHMSRLRI